MEIEEFKANQRELWGTGDYRPIGRLIEPAALTLVREAGVKAGQQVLDVGVGSGSVAVAAARAGAEVVGIDITDAWFDEAQRRADAAVCTPYDVSWRFKKPTFPVAFESPDTFESFAFENASGFKAARQALEEMDKWDETRTAIRAALDRTNEADDGSYRVTWDYLLAIASKSEDSGATPDG